MAAEGRNEIAGRVYLSDLGPHRHVESMRRSYDGSLEAGHQNQSGRPESRGVVNADLLQSMSKPATEWIRQIKQDARALEAEDQALAAGAALSMRSRKTAVAFGSTVAANQLLSSSRRKRAARISTNVVLGTEAKLRATTDAGSLLGKSAATIGVALQSRTPVINDIRIRGGRIGRLAASGSYWAPARQDLDTLLSKIDSRIVDDIIVIKGPYSSRYGPGFNFVDVQLLDSPRYENGFESHGTSSIEYKTNGEQWYGRQSFQGGDEDYGFRVGYGHRTGSDYDTGDSADGSRFRPKSLPTSYKSRDIDVAIGIDPTDDSRLEFAYLRQDQTDVEFPGLVFDINFLVTDGYELSYVLENQELFDTFTAEGWFNRTRFEGDTTRSGKGVQIPTLQISDQVVVGGEAITDVDGLSAGYRLATTWGEDGDDELMLGTDFIFLEGELNDVENRRSPVTNFPIPESHSADIGLFAEHSWEVLDQLTLRTGSRVDFIATAARNDVENLRDFNDDLETVEARKMASLDREFILWSAFATAEYEVDQDWTLTGGVGFAQRPPSLTELYAQGSYIGSLQPGLTALDGDPELSPERLRQIDVGLNGDYGSTRIKANGYYAWIRDYIAYDNFFAFQNFRIGQEVQFVSYTNTDLATISGFELSGEHDATDWMTAFAQMSFIEGRDHTRSEQSRIGSFDFNSPGDFRSSTPTASDHEPLPSIPPLETIIGVRLHEPGAQQNWGVEVAARIVDNQDRVARSLSEQETPGFTVWNARGFWKARENLLLISGVENSTDKFYREHLDYRSGRGVFQPGINFYFSAEVTW